MDVIQQSQGLERRSVDGQGGYGVRNTDYRTVGGRMKRKVAHCRLQTGIVIYITAT
jgi:hypothetical protein